MAISDAELESRIDEIAGGDASLRKTLLDTIGANEKAKTSFVNGFLGRADVTRKQQELAEQKKATERETETMKSRLTEYESKLTEAENEKDKVMRALADQRISAATANERLAIIKDRWQLSDEDLPTVTDIKKTEKSGSVVDSSDLDARFKKFESALMEQIQTKLIPEMGALAELPRVFANIDSEHREIFGKAMSKSERDQIMKLAKDEKLSIMGAWEQQFKVSDKRQELHDKVVEEKAIAKYEEKRVAEATERTLRGQSPDQPAWHQGSPLLSKKFAARTETAADDKGNAVQPVKTTSAAERVARSGAERARERHAKFIASSGASEGVSINRGPVKAA